MSTRIPHLTDRKETGLLLANKLQRFQDNPRTLILALPRGGVEVGCMLSTQLRLPLDVFLTRKLGYPRNPEYAVGAITEMRLTWFNADASDMKRTMGFKDFLDEEFPRQQWKLNGRKSCFDREKKLPPLDGYTIMLVDDGIATGSPFMALKANRSSNC